MDEKRAEVDATVAWFLGMWLPGKAPQGEAAMQEFRAAVAKAVEGHGAQAVKDAARSYIAGVTGGDDARECYMMTLHDFVVADKPNNLSAHIRHIKAKQADGGAATEGAHKRWPLMAECPHCHGIGDNVAPGKDKTYGAGPVYECRQCRACWTVEDNRRCGYKGWPLVPVTVQ